MNQLGPKDKFELIELLKNNFPQYKISTARYNYSQLYMKDWDYEDYNPKLYEGGISIQEICQHIDITKSYFLKARVSIRYIYDKQILMTDSFKSQNNIVLGDKCMLNTDEITKETFEKMHSKYEEKKIWVGKEYPKYFGFLENVISDNLKNEIEKCLIKKYGDILGF